MSPERLCSVPFAVGRRTVGGWDGDIAAWRGCRRRGDCSIGAGFTPERVAGAILRDTLARVTFTPARRMTSARIRPTFADGASLDAETALARGNPGNPMDWDDMRAKFMPLVTPVPGDRGAELYQLPRDFGDGDAMEAIRGIVAR